METQYFVTDLPKYLKSRQYIDNYFVDNTHVSTDIHISDCGGYILTIESYATREGCWVYTRGVVTRSTDGTVIADIKRNYSQFPFIFYGDYFVCGEDYQGYTVIDLVNAKQYVYYPDAASTGHGFCFASFLKHEKSSTLIVTGCVWGGWYEVLLLDFSNPTVLPLTEITRFNAYDSERIENDVLYIECESEYRLADGVLYDDLTDDEQNYLDATEGLTAWKVIVKKEYKLI